MDDMSCSMLWAHGFGCYEMLEVMNDMNDSRSYEFKDVDDMNDSWSWVTQGFGWHEWLKIMSLGLKMLWIAQGSGFYEQLGVLDDINDLGSCELKPLNAMNS